MKLDTAINGIKNTLWAACGALVYFIALTLTYEEPAPKLYVHDNLVSQCLPDNERTISQLSLQRNGDSGLYLFCEKHEAMGFGKMPPKPVHIQVAILKH